MTLRLPHLRVNGAVGAAVVGLLLILGFIAGCGILAGLSPIITHSPPPEYRSVKLTYDPGSLKQPVKLSWRGEFEAYPFGLFCGAPPSASARLEITYRKKGDRTGAAQGIAEVGWWEGWLPGPPNGSARYVTERSKAAIPRRNLDAILAELDPFAQSVEVEDADEIDGSPSQNATWTLEIDGRVITRKSAQVPTLNRILWHTWKSGKRIAQPTKGKERGSRLPTKVFPGSANRHAVQAPIPLP